MAKTSVEDVLRGLPEVEATILYLKCEELDYKAIAERRNRSVPWVTWQMASVYHKLLLDKKDEKTGQSLHKSVRMKILGEKVCPVLQKLIDGKSSNLKNFPLGESAVIEEFPIEWLEIIEGAKEIEPVIEGTIVEPPPPPPPEEFLPPILYNAWLLVIQDDKPNEPPPPPPPIVIPPRLPGQTRRPPIIPIILGTLAVCVCLPALIYGAYRLGRGASPTPPPILASDTEEVLVTETPTVTLTAAPADTLTPTLTSTPTATLTPIPTDTISPIGLGVGKELSDDRVTLRLTKVAYDEKYDRLGSRVAPISFYFDYTNHSGETTVVQFDKTNFVTQDNTGRTAECWFYHISGAVDKWNSTLNDGDTLQITARCGLDPLPPDVTTYTLTIHPFTSLPESTWVVNVSR